MDDDGTPGRERLAALPDSLADRPVRLEPARFGRPWGGGRLGAIGGQPVGELWVSGDGATLPDGRTLVEVGLAAVLPLVKVLDVDGRLSVQVHPDDATARELSGSEAVGKHEAWVVLDAPPGAAVALGLRSPTALEELFSADDGRITAALRSQPVVSGTLLDIPPGTVHAPAGPLLLYEIQQRSDLTFRVWDWGRPRPLHLVESRRAIRPDAQPTAAALPTSEGLEVVSRPGAPFMLRSCRLGRAVPSAEIALDRPAVLTVILGTLTIDPRPGAGDLPVALTHWLLPPGRWRLRGPGAGLVASTAP